jgi:DNA-binding LytR/AlgR family response regulator
MDISPISAVIIDDEPEAIRLLEMYLRFYPHVKITGTETNAKKGLDLVRQNVPELVFLDIDMPEMNGLKVAELIHSENYYSEIVFTTAHQHYAFDALDVQPLDFLTKPFNIEDLKVVLDKFREKADQKKFTQKVDQFIQAQANAPKIKLPTINGVLIVDVKDIILIKSKANNCNLYLDDGSIETITRNLIVVEEMLNPSNFFRVSRSAIINLKYLKRIDKKNLKCQMKFNNSVLEEEITRSNMVLFEKRMDFSTNLNS